MKNLLFATSVLLALGLFSCNQKAAQPAEGTAETTPMTSEPKKIDLKLADLGSDQDFICGMPLEEGHIGDTATYEGKIYGFCASECKAEFQKDPATYVAKLKK